MGTSIPGARKSFAIFEGRGEVREGGGQTSPQERETWARGWQAAPTFVDVLTILLVIGVGLALPPCAAESVGYGPVGSGYDGFAYGWGHGSG